MNTTRRTAYGRSACAALLAAIAFAGHSQEANDASLEVTIRLLPENAVGPEDITRRIELPPAVPSPGAAPSPADRADGSPPGADHGQGLDVAAEARERGRDFGQEVAEQARENRENAGRPDDAEPPADRPSPPRGPDDRPSVPQGRP